MRKISIEEFIERARKAYPEYDYSKTKYNGRHASIQIVCPAHGSFSTYTDRFFKQVPCPGCRKSIRQKASEKEFVEKAKAKFPDYDYSLVKYVNIDTKVRIICPKHGVFMQTPYEHIRGCGCSRCLGYHKTTGEYISEIKEIYKGRLDFSEFEYKGAFAPSYVTCLKCGWRFQIIPNRLSSGTGGCPHCRDIKFRQAGRDKRTENAKKKFQKDVASKYGSKYSVISDYAGGDGKIAVRCSVCGAVFDRTSRLFLQGYECVCQRTYGSLPEGRILDFLEGRGITPEREKMFSSLGRLRYDFYIPSKNLLVEYNGVQHYEYNSFFFNNHHGFLVQKHHDWLKRKYARDHGIRLLTIPYWEFDNIEKILGEAL